MPGKRKLLARVGERAGLTRLVEALPKRPSLLVLNYHRIGDADATPYDSGAFSCSTAEFDWQIGYLKSRFRIVGLAEAVALAHGKAATDTTAVLLTFDDGYHDNYEQAFPVLRARGVAATFFLPTAFIGTDALAWWDAAAFIAKNSVKPRIRLTYPEPKEFDLSPQRRAKSIMALLKHFKRPSVADPERLFRELEAECGVPRPAAGSARSFMSWDEAREMLKAGMSFGSHGHAHEILGRLTYGRQLEDLKTSRRILEKELGAPVVALAYPDGQPGTFNADTFRAAADAGFTTAFSYYSGVNVLGAIRPLDVLRGGVDGAERPSFRLRVALRAATRRELF